MTALDRLRIAVVGGGPAGLYFAYLWKSRHPGAPIRVYEQNPAGATWGFGVVFSDRALEFLRADEAETADAIAPLMEHWRNMTIELNGERIVVDGVGYSAIARLQLIEFLTKRARSAECDVKFNHAVHSLGELSEADLIVGADGINSVVRRAFEGDFKTSLQYGDNQFVWYGTDRAFETLTQTFVESPYGPFTAHHYRYAPGMSTFIIECTRDTWLRGGFDRKSADECKADCERIFARTLEGHPLISNKSVWRNFPWLWNERWHLRNVVLLGDALHTAHFSIGSGTRLAMEDAVALVNALDIEDDIERGLARYEAERRPIVKTLVEAARQSAEWYERFGTHMRLSPLDFAYSYITRSGRVDDARVRENSPRFMARLEEARLRIPDPVPSDTAGAREIGFKIPERYNASEILFRNLEQGRGDRLAVTGPLGNLSYRELCEAAERWGNAFLSLGPRRGDRIVFFLDDTPVYPATFFGALRAGLVPLLINLLTPSDLLQFYLADSGAAVAVTEAGCADRFNATACANTRLETLIIVNGEASGAPAVRTINAASWLPNFSNALVPADTHRDEMAFWMYSSGSTGRPKGIVHLQHDMAYTDLAYARTILRLKPDDICFSVPKIFFAYGFGNSITFPFSAGAASLLLPGQPRPAAIFEAIAKYRPTVFFALPTLYTALTKGPESRDVDFSSLRLAVSAAEILSAEVFTAWKALSGLEVVEGLGSTEVLHIYLSNTPQRKKLGSAGMRVPGYEIALRDREGREVAEGQEGILWVRGHSSTPLYWNRPEQSAETIRDGGWIYTGDRFVRDAEGFYFFRGRADDLVKISGQWVYPLEVELCLADHPAVRECAVLALELPDRRTTLKAFVVMNDTGFDAERARITLQDYVKQKLLPYKYPRIVEFLDDLPKTGTGKIDRQALRNLEPSCKVRSLD
jgi:benzoate-CoA ligase family protein